MKEKAVAEMAWFQVGPWSKNIVDDENNEAAKGEIEGIVVENSRTRESGIGAHTTPL